MTKKHVVLSDIDGTLLNGSLVLNHAAWLEEKGLIATNGLVTKWLNDKKNEDLITQLAEHYREQITGKTLQELKVESYLSDYTNEDFYTKPINILLKAYNRGAVVHLISGSPSFLVKKLATRLKRMAKAQDKSHKLNLSGKIIGHGSIYHLDSNKRLTGEITPMYHAEAKQEKIDSILLRESNLHVTSLGDTASDMPLLKRANKAYLVDPNMHTVQAYESAGIKYQVI